MRPFCKLYAIVILLTSYSHQSGATLCDRHLLATANPSAVAAKEVLPGWMFKAEGFDQLLNQGRGLWAAIFGIGQGGQAMTGVKAAPSVIRLMTRTAVATRLELPTRDQLAQHWSSFSPNSKEGQAVMQLNQPRMSIMITDLETRLSILFGNIKIPRQERAQFDQQNRQFLKSDLSPGLEGPENEKNRLYYAGYINDELLNKWALTALSQAFFEYPFELKAKHVASAFEIVFKRASGEGIDDGVEPLKAEEWKAIFTQVQSMP